MTDIIELVRNTAKQVGFHVEGNMIFAESSHQNIANRLTKLSQLLQQVEAELFKPHPQCDRSCMYACTEGFTKRAKCIDKTVMQGEVVAYYVGNLEGKSDFKIALCNADLDIPLQSPLYTTPPDTQQKLDKAREALQEIVDMHVSSDDGFIAIGIAQQALKDIS